MAANLSWLWLIGAGVLAIGGIALVTWALFADRSRGRKRCPKCWYDMSATVGLKCPECGREARGERGLLRTRRRWRWAVVGVGLVLGPLVAGRFINQASLWRIMPTQVIVGWLTVTGWPARSSAADEIVYRMNQPTVPTAKRDAFYDRFADQCIETRSRWPKSVPLAVRVEAPGWYKGASSRVLSASLKGTENQSTRPAASSLVVGWAPLVDFSQRWRDRTASLGVIPQSADPVAFNLTLTDDTSGVLWKGVTDRRIQMTETIYEVIRPMSNAELDELIGQSIRVSLDRGVTKNGIRGRMTLQTVHFGREWPKELDSVALAFRVEARHKAIVIATGRCWFQEIDRMMGQCSSVEMDSDIADFLAAERSDPEWDVRISGDPELALRDFERDTFWAGEVVVPLTRVNRSPPQISWSP